MVAHLPLASDAQEADQLRDVLRGKLLQQHVHLLLVDECGRAWTGHSGVSSTHTTISSLAGMVSTSSFMRASRRSPALVAPRAAAHHLRRASTSPPAATEASSWKSSAARVLLRVQHVHHPEELATLFWMGVPVRRRSQSYPISITAWVVCELTSLSLCASSTTQSAHSNCAMRSVSHRAVSKETRRTSNLAGPFGPRPSSK